MHEYIHICMHRHIKWMHNMHITCMPKSSLSNYCICIHMYTHSYMQTYIHTYKCAHACIHACILHGRFRYLLHLSCIYTIHIHTWYYMHAYVCVCVHIYIYINIYIYIHTHTQQYTMYKYDTHACMHGKGCLRIYKEHANMHTYMHACICMRIL